MTNLTPRQRDESVSKIAARLKKESIDLLLWFFEQAYRPQKGKSPEALRLAFNLNKFLNQEQTRDLMVWKSSARLGLLENNPPNYLILSAATKNLGTEAARDGNRPSLIRLLIGPGVKISRASAVLAAWSDEFPIIDPRTWQALYWLTENTFFESFDRGDTGAYESYVEILRCVGKRVGCSARELDKALFILGGKLS